MLLDTQVYFRVSLVCSQCTALEWPADNVDITPLFETQQCKTIMTLSDHNRGKSLGTLLKKKFPARFSNNVCYKKFYAADYEDDDNDDSDVYHDVKMISD
jgi:hypothetical protein